MAMTSDLTYEHIADALASDEYIAIPNFLPAATVKDLRDEFESMRAREAFRKAGIGKAEHFMVEKEVRGDWIKWIDGDTASATTQIFLKQIDDLMQALNRLLFLSMKDFECHFAIYPPGTFYEKHLDQFQSTNQRKLSFAFYLNENWQMGDGGEIRIHRGEQFLDIPPRSGTLVLFRSDTVEHEVLITQKDRYSITGWMRDRPLDFPIFRQGS